MGDRCGNSGESRGGPCQPALYVSCTPQAGAGRGVSEEGPGCRVVGRAANSNAEMGKWEGGV